MQIGRSGLEVVAMRQWASDLRARIDAEPDAERRAATLLKLEAVERRILKLEAAIDRNRIRLKKQ